MNWYTSPMMINQTTLSLDWNYCLKSLDTARMEPINQKFNKSFWVKKIWQLCYSHPNVPSLPGCILIIYLKGNAILYTLIFRIISNNEPPSNVIFSNTHTICNSPYLIIRHLPSKSHYEDKDLPAIISIKF